MHPKHILIAAAGALSLAIAPAMAQQQSGLVNVTVSDVANDLARNLSVDVSQIPVTVQVPVGVAANVCGVSANVLAQQGVSGAGCTAKSTSTALNQHVQKSLRKG